MNEVTDTTIMLQDTKPCELYENQQQECNIIDLFSPRTTITENLGLDYLVTISEDQDEYLNQTFLTNVQVLDDEKSMLLPDQNDNKIKETKDV